MARLPALHRVDKPLGRRPNRLPRPLTERVAGRVQALPPHLSAEERAAKTQAIEADEQAREARLRRPVAGFDLTFSVPKSVSAIWAVPDEATKAIIYSCHLQAIDIVLAYAEREVLHTRRGTNGIVQDDVRGAVTTAFDHWDSRAGDPHLHTHAVIVNRVQATDGTWRTLDSRGLFKAVVALSEMHEGLVQDLCTQALGWAWDPRRRLHSGRPRWEVTGVRDTLRAEFSRRSQQIERYKNALGRQFAAARGRQPTSAEWLRLRQQATLATRPAKQHRSLAELTLQWRARAAQHLDCDPVAWVETLRDRVNLPPLRRDDLNDDMLAEAGDFAVLAVAARRATFTRANVLAEIHRQLHGVRFACPQERIAIADRTVDRALAGVVHLSAPELRHTPAAFRRADGSSRFRAKGAETYTTQTLLDAETRLLDAGRSCDGPTLSRALIAAICDQAVPGRSHHLSVDQALAVEQIAASGRVLDVLVGPAGTGKTLCMAGLRAVWEAQHGPGTVVGLAPSAVAAQALGDELRIATENTAKWLTEASREPQRLAELADLHAIRLSPQDARREANRLRRAITAARQAGDPAALRELEHELVTALPYLSERARQARIRTLTGEIERWRLRRGQLIIVDEASLAGTFALDALLQYAREAGGKVLLVGDWAQLSAVEAGGAFSMLVIDRHPTPELVDVRRFSNKWEKAASIELRVGCTDAIDMYIEHGRIRGGSRADMVDALYTAWKRDVAKANTSLMIAGDLATVTELNARARAERVAAGEVTEHGLMVADGLTAGIGDRVVTRENNRRLTTGRRWVKNGDTWIVTATGNDGSMTVQRDGRRPGGQVVLPADYVCEHVELGYATTAYRAQGRTVDTAHAIVSVTTTREVAYVSATRGKHTNHIYVDTCHDPDFETAHGELDERSPREVLQAVLANVGSDRSAHQTISDALDNASSTATLAAEYQTIAKAAQADRWDALIARSGLTPDQLDQLRDSDAYGPLITALREAEARGLNVDNTFGALVSARPLNSAEDIASVLHDRVDRWVKAASPTHRPPASNLIAGLIPAALNITDPDMRQALDERADAMQRRARLLAEKAIRRGEPWPASSAPHRLTRGVAKHGCASSPPSPPTATGGMPPAAASSPAKTAPVSNASATPGARAGGRRPRPRHHPT